MAYVPVKATLSTMGWLAIAAPAVGPYPGTMLTTPAGKPASLMSSAMYSPVKGVCSANFITTVFPVASAGPNFQACKIITLKRFLKTKSKKRVDVMQLIGKIEI